MASSSGATSAASPSYVSTYPSPIYIQGPQPVYVYGQTPAAPRYTIGGVEYEALSGEGLSSESTQDKTLQVFEQTGITINNPAVVQEDSRNKSCASECCDCLREVCTIDNCCSALCCLAECVCCLAECVCCILKCVVGFKEVEKGRRDHNVAEMYVGASAMSGNSTAAAVSLWDQSNS